MTLLEVMAATAILGMFLMSVYALVWSTLKTRDDIEEAALPYTAGPVVLQRVLDDLRGAIVEPFKDYDAFRATTESTGDDSAVIDFVTTVDSRVRVEQDEEWLKSAVCEVGYRIRRSETAEGLFALYRREDFGVDDEPLEGGKFYKVVDRVKTFRIDWFEEDTKGEPAGDEAEGVPEWDAKKEKRLPWACRVTLVLVGDELADDEGDVVEDAKEYTFLAYVAFASRFDKADSAAPSGPGNPGNPGGR